MLTEPVVERILVDLHANRLLLELDRPLDGPIAPMAIIDIGALGRLLGVEVAGVYLRIADPVAGSELQGRAVEAQVHIVNRRRQLVAPRRGRGWELSFPSGNQCWRRRDDDGVSRSLCAELTGF